MTFEDAAANLRRLPGIRRKRRLPHRRTSSEPLVAGGILLFAVVLVYHELALTNLVPFGYDLFTYFYPHLAYAGDRFRSGQLPLWNPYLFAGAPFLGNIQTAVFYPATWLSVWLTPTEVIRYASLFHVWLAAVATYWFVRFHLGVVPLGALLTALCFALGGFVSSQFGHPNQLAAAAWLPVILLAASRAVALRSLGWVGVLSLAVTFQFFAGHTQEFYFSMVMVVTFVAWEVVGRLAQVWRSPEISGDGRVRATVDALFWGGVPLAVGLGLASLLMAPQLLPTLELSRLSIRGGGLSFEEASSFSWPPTQILRGLLPPFGESPYGEYIGYSGILGAGFAVYGTIQGRARWQTTFFLLVALAALALAFGGFNPLYPELLRRVPGLGLFRVPARWLFVSSFAIAVLAGSGLDAAIALARHGVEAAIRHTGRLATVLVVLAGVLLLILPYQSLPSDGVVTAWLIFGALTAVALVFAVIGWFPERGAAVVVGIALAELFLAGMDLDGHRLTLPEAYSSRRPLTVQLSLDSGLFRILSISLAEYEPGDAAELRSLLSDVLSRPAITDLLIAHKYKELLIPNQGLRFRIPTLDGYDGGVLPLRQFVEFKQVLFENAGLRAHTDKPVDPMQPDGLLREQLGGIPSPELLGLLNVKYVVMDRTEDIWLAGLYVDGALGRTIRGGTLVDLPGSQLEGTQLILALRRGSAPVLERGSVLMLVRTVFPDGTFEWSVGSPGAGSEVSLEEIPSNPSYQLARLKFPSPRRIVGIQIAVPSGAPSVTLAGATVSDDRVGVSEPLAVDDRFRLVHLGDLKVYENQSLLERAFIAYSYEIGASSTDVVRGLRSRIRQRVMVDRDPGFPRPTSERPFHSAEILSYEPEHVRIRADAQADGLLVLTDAAYPGWEAYIDGRAQPILTVNSAFRGVTLTAGVHEVEFIYRPVSQEVGRQLAVAGVSGLTVLFVGALLLARLGARR